MKTTNYFSVLIFFVILGIGIAFSYVSFGAQANALAAMIDVIFFFIALIVSCSIKVADQWEKAVVLRLGGFQSLRGPGLFFIIPVIDTIPYWIDTRVITSSFTAEKTLTKDTVPVDVDAVLFWKVLDPKKAAIDVADYKSAINWASQTALRDVIGKTRTRDVSRALARKNGWIERRNLSGSRTHAHQQTTALERIQRCHEGILAHAVEHHRAGL